MTTINPSMNIGSQGIEEDRTINNVEFDSMFHITTAPATEKEATVPYNSPSHLDNHVNPSSDSQKIEVGPSAHDIVDRTRMGG